MLVLSGGLSIKMWWSSSRGFLGALLALLPLHLFIFHSTFFIFISISKPILASSYSNYANQYTSHSSFLDLSPGLNLSISNSYNFSDYHEIGTSLGDFSNYADPKHSESLLFKLGMPTVDAGGLFLPILSSPLFNRSHESPNSGFSLGFYISPLASYKDGPDFHPYFPCEIKGCHIYMAVCAGSSGYFNSSLTGYNLDQVLLGGATGTNSSSPVIAPFVSVDGFVAPVWIANMGRPIKDATNASLVALEVPDSKGHLHMELQLRDGDQVVWKVSDVGMMEIQDTGKLLIYSSPSRTKVVWQSPSTTDTLIHGQNLTEGMELRSNDSSYIARVEKGGLVLYLNKICFSMEPQPPPYWIFPIPRWESQSHNTTANIRDLVYSVPCSNSSAYIFLNVTDEQALHVSDSRSCGVSTALANTGWIENANVSWGFLRLENDGRLYIYAVANPINSPASATRLAVDTFDYIEGHRIGLSAGLEQWGECDVPMACGPSGICTPGANTICSCQESFEPVDSTDISQGCKPRTTLPNCSIGTEHVHTTGFVELPSTASIFLFNLWSFNFTNGSVDACKNWCSSNCSCKGFIYQRNVYACLFIADDDISLLHVADTNLTFLNYANFSLNDVIVQQVVLASNYVTYLKVVAVSPPSEVHGASDRVVLRTILMAIIPSIV
eukprot:c25409_g1_i1 orf=414-2414(+)